MKRHLGVYVNPPKLSINPGKTEDLIMAATITAPNTRFLYLRSQAGGQIKYDAGGTCRIQLDSKTGSIVDITGFRQVSVCISSQKSVSRSLMMGTISGTTLAQTYALPLDSKIHTFNVVGPEMSLYMNGPANTTEQIQLWIYLRS